MDSLNLPSGELGYGSYENYGLNEHPAELGSSEDGGGKSFQPETLSRNSQDHLLNLIKSGHYNKKPGRDNKIPGRYNKKPGSDNKKPGRDNKKLEDDEKKRKGTFSWKKKWPQYPGIVKSGEFYRVPINKKKKKKKKYMLSKSIEDF